MKWPSIRRSSGRITRFNPWWGCARVSAACRFCYAETLADRFHPGLWGVDADRRPASEKMWAQPERWDRAAAKAGRPARVFCASMADVFEDRDDLDPHRERLWDLIGRTHNLIWLLLTKRPEHATRMVPERWLAPGMWPSNVWVGATVENQDAADTRVPRLVEIPARVRFLSCEPLLGPVDIAPWVDQVDWVIAGGESGRGARPSHPDWFRGLRDQCYACPADTDGDGHCATCAHFNPRWGFALTRGHRGPAFLFKQWGEWMPGRSEARTVGLTGKTPQGGREHRWIDHQGDTRDSNELVGFVRPDDWVGMVRVGKTAAGRLLDGRTWDEFPGERGEPPGRIRNDRPG